MLLRCVDVMHARLDDGRILPIAETAASSVSPTDSGPLLVLPAELCGIHELSVSREEARLLHRTLPWRLEESVLTDCEQLHVSASALVDGRVAVSYVARDALNGILQHCADAGIAPMQAYAELGLIPWQPGQWSLWLEDDGDDVRVLVRHGWHRGFVCGQDNVGSALQVVSNEQQGWPQQVVVYGTAAQFEAVHEALPPSLQALLVLRRAPAWSELVAAQSLRCNVLQGDFAPPLPWRRWWQQWRVAALLLVALVAADGLFTLLETSRIRAAEAALQQELVTLFRSAVPQGQLVDPVAQLRAVVTQAGGNQQALLPLLTLLAPALQSAPDAQVQSLDFNAENGELQLQIRSGTLAAAEALRGSIQALGLQADLLGSNSDGNGSRSRLRVRRI